MQTIKTTLATTALCALVAPAFAQDNPTVGGAPMFADRTIVENAVNSADHTTLVAAVQAADLVETLSGEGPFTVFAPTNAAFEALPDGTVETLLMPENKEQLTEILTCHVVAADAMSDAIRGMIADDGGAHPVPTVGGCTLNATYEGGSIMLEDEQGRTANVTIADVDQSNGVIHVIDSVLLPAADDAMESESMQSDATESDAMQGDAMESGAMESDAMESDAMESDAAAAGDNPMVGGAPMFAERNIVENAVNSEDHTTLVTAVKAAGLVETLQSEGPFTVFAPVNAAFEALPAGTVETLLEPQNKDQLTKILTAHVVPGDLSAANIQANTGPDGFYHMQTVSGDALSAQVQPSGNVYIFDENGNAYEVTIADVNQSNGVIHVVDGVLLPR